MSAEAFGWVAGLTFSVFCGALVFVIARWIDRCPRCKKYGPPKSLRREVSPIDYVIDHECERCGHRWQSNGTYIE